MKFSPLELAQKFRVPVMISTLPHWDCGWWALLSATLIMVVLVDGSFQINKKSEEKIAELTATRAKLEVDNGDVAPDVLSDPPWLYRRFRIFNTGPAVAENISVRLREICSQPTMAVGILDLPLDVFSSGGSDPFILRLDPNDAAIFTVLDAHPDAPGPAAIVRWRANKLGKGHTYMPSIYL